MLQQDVFAKNALSNTHAIITGGGTGIGFGIATRIVQLGGKVALMGRRLNILQQACEKLNRIGQSKDKMNNSNGVVAVCFQGDVRDEQSCIDVVKHACEYWKKPVNVLVNNAAGNFAASAEDLSPKGFKTVVEIDLLGTFNMCKAVLPFMKESNSSVIINISATLHYLAFPFMLHASSAKAGIDVLTQVLGVEWAEYGIRVVGIAPGPIKGTEGGLGGRVFGGFSSVSMAILEGTVEDIGNAAAFLISGAARFITATTVVVDGGMWHQSHGTFLGLKDAMHAQVSQRQTSSKL